MPLQMDNPNHAVQPNYTTDEFADARQRLINDHTNDDQAAAILTNIWAYNNEKDKQRWTARLAEEAQATEEAERRAAEEAAQRQLELEEEETQSLREERKNKAKFAPIRKAARADFCELWYFMNEGLAKAENSGSFTFDDSSMTLMQGPDGNHSFVASSIAKDKAVVIRDEDLTWEQFTEAAIRMLEAMKDHEWPDNRIEMHIKFWSALESHRWRHSCFAYHKWALLVYQ
ncbi:hypothetical protein BDN67DRAFT_870218, partial [Paxillus ammoniavirescens]